jgi:hypothetical protein
MWRSMTVQQERGRKGQNVYEWLCNKALEGGKDRMCMNDSATRAEGGK